MYVYIRSIPPFSLAEINVKCNYLLKNVIFEQFIPLNKALKTRTLHLPATVRAYTAQSWSLKREART